MSTQSILPWSFCAKSVVASTTFLAAAALITGITLTVLKSHSPLSIGLMSGGGSVIVASVFYTMLASCKTKKNRVPVETKTETAILPSGNSIPSQKLVLIQSEVKKIKQWDVKQKNNGWQAFEKKDPVVFRQWQKDHTRFSFKNPHVLQVGDLSTQDLKIIHIVSEYLSIFFHIPFKLQKETVSLEKYKKEQETKIQERKNYQKQLEDFQSKFPRIKKNISQYDADLILLGTCKNCDPQSSTEFIGFTKVDLFADDCKNFVFGTAVDNYGAICSIARFGQNFRSILKRTLTIAVHEFGHVRELPHCDCGHCCMNGYLSLGELDSSPLIYCSEDTAKLCYQTGISILEHSKNVLAYLKNLQTELAKEKIDLPIQWEVNILEKRIAALSN